ncbi:MAG TPA: type II secretion system protein [Candidatus Woesebacteria bacterium]|nr:type II secretion system protein [Candidatus Woesebacteria bacterium]
MKKHINSSGFSLIELILYVALLGIIVSGMVTFGLNVVQIRIKNRVEQEVIANTRLVTRRINYEIRNSSAVNSVTAESISLASGDSARNPTVISLSGGTVTIGYGSTGSCSTIVPCPLTSRNTTVQSLLFADMSSGVSPQSVKYEVVVKGEVAGAGKSYYYKEYATGSAEVRSK